MEGDIRERTDNVEVEGDLGGSHDGMIEWSNHEFSVVDRGKILPGIELKLSRYSVPACDFAESPSEVVGKEESRITP